MMSEKSQHLTAALTASRTPPTSMALALATAPVPNNLDSIRMHPKYARVSAMKCVRESQEEEGKI